MIVYVLFKALLPPLLCPLSSSFLTSCCWWPCSCTPRRCSGDFALRRSCSLTSPSSWRSWTAVITAPSLWPNGWRQRSSRLLTGTALYSQQGGKDALHCLGAWQKASNQWNNCCIHWSDCVFTSKSIKNQHDLTLICSFYPFFPQRSHRGLLPLPNGGEVLDDQALLAEADHLLLPVPRSDSAHPALRLRLPGLLPPPGLHYRRLRLQAACRPARVRHRRPRQGAV